MAASDVNGLAAVRAVARECGGELESRDARDDAGRCGTTALGEGCRAVVSIRDEGAVGRTGAAFGRLAIRPTSRTVVLSRSTVPLTVDVVVATASDAAVVAVDAACCTVTALSVAVDVTCCTVAVAAAVAD